MERIDTAEVETIFRRLTQLLDAHPEWFCAEEGSVAKRDSLRRSECELRIEHGRLLFSYFSERRGRIVFWRITACDFAASDASVEKIRLAARAGSERVTLELVPRASAGHAAATIAAARRAVCEQLAETASEMLGATVEQIGLSPGARRSEPGRFARIVLRRGRGELIAVTGNVADATSPDTDALLASALVWFTSRLGGNKRAASAKLQLCLIGAPKAASALAAMCALLRADMRRLISVYKTNDDFSALAPVSIPTTEELFSGASSTPLYHSSMPEASEWAQRIIALAPDAIDVVRSRHGETLRFHGLAFARVRRVMTRGAHIWFGVERAQMKPMLLDEEGWPEFLKLIVELNEHRRVGGSSAHALYRAAPEAWLESLLRRDVTQLDPGLVISPLHTQFRAAARTSVSHRAPSRPVDLLALRSDGRLVVIELKTTEDAALPLQAADYFRVVETHRRMGAISAARLFGDLPVADLPPLIYTVAPGLRFARSFETLARLIAPEIEIYRFDINEDWRAGVRVMRRARCNFRQ